MKFERLEQAPTIEQMGAYSKGMLIKLFLKMGLIREGRLFERDAYSNDYGTQFMAKFGFRVLANLSK